MEGAVISYAQPLKSTVRDVIRDNQVEAASNTSQSEIDHYFDEICIKANQTCGESLRDQAVSGTPRLAIRLNDQQPVRSSKLNSPFATSFEGHGLPAAKGERLPTGEVDDSRDLSEQSSCLQKSGFQGAGAPPASIAASPAPAPAQQHRLRQRCVLVAKCLTNSDASSGRIILPRVAVEANLPFVTAYRHYSLAVRDTGGRRHDFVIKSWANGNEHRRVFVLEQAAHFLRTHHVGVGDTVGICADENGDLVVEVNTEEVRHATVCPRYGALALTAPPTGVAAASAAAVPLAAMMAGRCARSTHCTKAAGHPGFCSGPKAAAAAAAAAAAQAHAAGAAASARYLCRPALAASHFAEESSLNCTAEAAAAAPPTAAAATPIFTALQAVATATAADGECSSDADTALTHMRLASHNAAAHMYLPSHLSVPPGLPPVAHIPAGLRLDKQLTAYDLSSRRILLPADAVDAGVPNARDLDALTLAAVDESRRWHFLSLRAWNSVAGRRGYLVDDAAALLEGRGACAGDVLSVFRSTDLSPPRIEVRAADTGEVRQPAAPDAELTFAQLPLLLHPGRDTFGGGGSGVNGGSGSGPASSSGTPRCGGNASASGGGGGSMVCRRTSGCTKSVGHQGFCSGHKGFKRREGSATPTAGSRPRQHRLATERGPGYRAYADDDEFAGSWGSDDDDYTPSAKRFKKMNTGGSSAPSGEDPLLSLLELLDA